MKCNAHENVQRHRLAVELRHDVFHAFFPTAEIEAEDLLRFTRPMFDTSMLPMASTSSGMTSTTRSKIQPATLFLLPEKNLLICPDAILEVWLALE